MKRKIVLLAFFSMFLFFITFYVQCARANTPPTQPVVELTPNFPGIEDDLTCTVTTPSTDPDGDTIWYTYEWYKNRICQSDLTTTTTALRHTISSSHTEEGDVWQACITPNDGKEDGEQATSNNLTIQNIPPTQPVVDVTPNFPVTTDDLTCTVTIASTDLNNDIITYYYRWYKNGIWQSALTTTTTALSDTISSSHTAPGEVWKCVVTPNDGTADGPSDEDQVTIQSATVPEFPLGFALELALILVIGYIAWRRKPRTNSSMSAQKSLH